MGKTRNIFFSVEQEPGAWWRNLKDFQTNWTKRAKQLAHCSRVLTMIDLATDPEENLRRFPEKDGLFTNVCGQIQYLFWNGTMLFFSFLDLFRYIIVS